VDGPLVYERKRDERVEGEKLMWQVAPREMSDVAKTGVVSAWGVICTVSLVRRCMMSSFVV